MKAQLVGDDRRVAAVQARMRALEEQKNVRLVAPLSMRGARLTSLSGASASSSAAAAEDLRERVDKRGKRKRSSIIASRPDAANALGAADGSADGSKLSLRELVEMEKSSDGRRSMDEVMARNIIAQGAGYKGGRLGSSGGASRAGASSCSFLLFASFILLFAHLFIYLSFVAHASKVRTKTSRWTSRS